jgi:hypothetical protein
MSKHYSIHFLFFLGSLTAIFQACKTTSNLAGTQPQKSVVEQRLFAITDVNIIPMTPENKIIEQTNH